MDDVELIRRLIPHWYARRAEFQRLIIQSFDLKRINDFLSIGRHTKPIQIPGTPWFCWQHGIGVRIARQDETGGIDFDFDKPDPDAWRLRDFAERQIEENAEDADLLRSLAADHERFDRAFDAVQRMVSARRDAFPETALAVLRGTRWNPEATCSYEGMSGALRWDDEFPDEAIKACIREDNWAFRFVWAYRASLIRGQPCEELRAAWEQLSRECPEWPGFHPERRSTSLRERLDSDAERFLREFEELDAQFRTDNADASRSASGARIGRTYFKLWRWAIIGFITITCAAVWFARTAVPPRVH